MQQIQNGLYATRKTGDGFRSIFIDEEVLELQGLNEAIERNRERNRRSQMAQLARIDVKQKEQRRRKIALRRIVRQEMQLIAMAVAVYAGQRFGLVDWTWSLPVLIIIQAAVCWKAGRYFGKSRKV